jgi:hypothetical protein
MAFDAVDDTGAPVYHTNVMMAVGTELALIALDMITDDRRRTEVSARLSARHEVIALTRAQIAEFAGNAIELQGASGRILVMSARARAALRADQVAAIERSARIVAVPVPTIELAGGSVRCMIAGIHLDPRPLVA